MERRDAGTSGAITDDAKAVAWLRRALGLDETQRPFPWQVELLRRWLSNERVSSLDIPTGLGKTSVMAIWLIARACGATVPRRLVYVVDRRVVVDQATEVAESLREWVSSDKSVRDALGLSDRELPISTLRGQHVDNRAWLEDPASPAIVVGTVDMVGSRLLFSGYGVSARMRPYHAGLLGADTLVVLDEAHLVPPFERLLEAIEHGTAPHGPFAAKADAASIVPRIRLLSLSATGRQKENALTLSDADRANEVVKKRLGAKKLLTVRDTVPEKQLAQRLADEAWSLSEGQPVRVIVCTTSRDVAQDVSELLSKHSEHVELFVGARRVYERTLVAKWLVEHGFIEGPDRKRAAPSGPVFLVATSAGEVGVDMDAHHMVADLVAWERMVQRLGRVNRRGEGEAKVIVVPKEEGNENEKERAERVRSLLLRLPSSGDGHDASPGAIVNLKASYAVEIEEASSVTPLHPALSRPVLESWSMTSLEEHTGRPEVQPWIRGWVEDEEPQTALLFRRELPIDEAGSCLADEMVAAYLNAAPPHLKEKLETETSRVIKWLDERSKSLAKGRAAMEATDSTAVGKHTVVGLLLKGASVTELRFADLDDKSGRERLSRALQGATLLLDARIGGLRQGLLDGAHKDASDVGEAGDLPFRISRVSDAEPADGTGSRAYREEARLCVAQTDGVERKWLLIETLVRESAESEEGRSVTPSRAQLLDEHEAWTEQEALSLAARLGLGDAYASMLALAARLHDEGKRARSWQRAFGVSDAEMKRGHVYGKTTYRPNLALLARYRHELGSLPRAEQDARVRTLTPELRDLCLHLIASHHGFARPLLRTDGAEEPPSALTRRAQEIALRFTQLEKTWGPWGLAWWEALLRAADQRASRRNDEGDREHG